MTTQVNWSIEVDYLQACSCDYGCPCEFQAPPTQGFCEGLGAYRINRGNYGDVSLDGLGLGFALHSPGALHLGDMTLALFVDEKASQEQRDALIPIASGQAGGQPFEIIASLVSNLSGPYFVPFQFDLQGRNSAAKMGDSVSMAFEAIKNPVTGEPELARLVHETGFLFQEADVISAKECRASVEGLSFSWPDHSGFLAKIRYGNS